MSSSDANLGRLMAINGQQRYNSTVQLSVTLEESKLVITTSHRQQEDTINMEKTSRPTRLTDGQACGREGSHQLPRAAPTRLHLVSAGTADRPRRRELHLTHFSFPSPSGCGLPRGDDVRPTQATETNLVSFQSVRRSFALDFHQIQSYFFL